MNTLLATIFLASALNSAACLQNVRTDGCVDEFFGNLAEEFNGTTIPGGLEGLLTTAKVALKGNADIAADALIKIAPILDDGKLEKIFKSYGYTLWSGSDLDRKIDIQKKYTVGTYPTPNDLADKLAELLNSPLDSACTELDKAGDGSDALLTDGVKNLLKLFDVDLGDVGDLHLDKADLMALKAVLKTVRGAVALLKGTDLENDYGTFVKVLGDIDAEAFFVEVPALFKGKRNQTQLTNSRDALKLALTTVKDADALIRSRTDGKPHLIGVGEAGHLIPYGDDKIFTVLRDNSAALIAALDGPSAINVKGIFAALGETCPTWLTRDTYRISLLPLFQGKYAQTISPAVEPDGTLWPETLPDPTFGGLLPDLTMSEALAVFESMQRDQLWTWAAYDTYRVNMPFRDGTANSHGGRRTIVAEVSGASNLAFTVAMANASAQSSLTLTVDGVFAGVWSNDAPEKVTIQIAGEGTHKLAWTFAVEGNALQETAGVHPVTAYAYCAEEQEPEPEPEPEPVQDTFRAGEEVSGALAERFVGYKGGKVKGLPAGVKWDKATGLLKGTPTKPGVYAVTFTVGGVPHGETLAVGNYADAAIPVADAYGPFQVGVIVLTNLADAAKGCAVKGLPGGLKFAKGPLTDKVCGAVPAGAIYGVPKKAGTFTAVFTRKAGSVKHKASSTITVAAMPAWVRGTYNGGGANGVVTLAVSKAGKVTGKYLSGGKTWKLSAPALAAYDEATSNYAATVAAKCRRETGEFRVTLGEFNPEYRMGVLAGEGALGSFEAYRNAWKEQPLKALAAGLRGRSDAFAVEGVGEIVLTVGSSGSVKAKLTTTGLDGKPYSATCSTVLLPVRMPDATRIYVYFPPKKDKFAGFTAAFDR